MNYQYRIPKKELSRALQGEFIKDKSEDEIRDEIKGIFPADLYSFQESDRYYCFSLNDSISVNDVISIYDEFNKIAKRDERDRQDIERRRNELIRMKTIKEVVNYATNETINFWSYELQGYIYSEPHIMFGETVWINMYISGIAFYIGNCKTLSESSIESFDIFTDLLRYRLKRMKLSEAMSVFLTE